MTTSTTTNDLNYDPTSIDTARNPHDLFRRLRNEAPLYYNEERDFYALSRLEDVERAHIDRQTFLSGRGVTLSMITMNFPIPKGTVLFEDAPTHAIHRSMLAQMFTARRVADLEPTIRQLCADLLDPFVGVGSFDFETDFGAVMPTKVIGMLVGIPEQDQIAVRDHFDANRTRETQNDRGGEGNILDGEIFADYIDWRVEHPSDDIMTVLLNVEFEDETGTTRRLTREELLAYVNIVAAAGNDTTRRLIGWTGKVLADHPDQRRLLLEDPSLVPQAIDEILRFEPPTNQACRYVAHDVELHGTTVPQGSVMALLLTAANRDDRHFDTPDRFDVSRAPGQIFSFGWGPHYCLGQALARLEGRIALEEVLRRFPVWEVDADNSQFGFDGDGGLRGWDRLPVFTM
jgi:cytochrome P450